MTNVIPIAAIKRKGLSINKSKKTFREKKPLNETDPIPNIIIKRAIVAASRRYLKLNIDPQLFPPFPPVIQESIGIFFLFIMIFSP